MATTAPAAKRALAKALTALSARPCRAGPPAPKTLHRQPPVALTCTIIEMLIENLRPCLRAGVGSGDGAAMALSCRARQLATGSRTSNRAPVSA